MKFLCENCKAKYQIADEKVAGRSVRMKCRKCGHLIEIRSSVTETSATLVFSANLLRAGASDAPASIASPGGHGVTESPTRASAIASMAGPVPSARPSVPRPGPRETRQPPSRASEGMAPTGTVVHGGLASAFQQAVAAEAKAASEPAPAAGGEWFVGIGGSPIGPIGIDELRARASAGEVQEDSLIWREGFAEWVPVGTVPELRDVARLVRAERSPLSSRAGALVGRLGIGPRSSRPPSGGQAGPLSSRNDSARAGAGAQVHETLALSPGAMPLVLPGLVGRAGSPANAPTASRSPVAPSSPAPSQVPPSPPAAPAPASPFGAPGMGNPAMGGQGMGGQGMGGQGMGQGMGGQAMGQGMGQGMGGQAMGPGMGQGMGGQAMGPGMGPPGFGGMGGPMQQPQQQLQQQVMPFQQPFGMGAPAGFGQPPAAGFPTTGFVPMGTPPRRKGGIPLAGWFAVAAALGTGVAVGAMLFKSAPAGDVEVKTETTGGGEAGASGDTADSSAGGATAEANGAGGASAEGAAGEGAGGASAEGAGGASAEGAGGSGAEEAAGAAGASDGSAGAAGEGAAGSNASSLVASNARPRPGGVRRPTAHRENAGSNAAADVKPVPTVQSITPPPVTPNNVAGPTGRSPGGGGGGQLSSEQVQGVVNNGRAAIRRACWEPALAAKGGGATSTRVTVSIAIGADGKVQQATSSGGDNFPSLGGCIAGRVRSWIFPSSGSVTQTTATFNFAAQ